MLHTPFGNASHLVILVKIELNLKGAMHYIGQVFYFSWSSMTIFVVFLAEKLQFTRTHFPNTWLKVLLLGFSVITGGLLMELIKPSLGSPYVLVLLSELDFKFSKLSLVKKLFSC